MYRADGRSADYDITSGWHGILLHGLEVKHVPGDHTTMMQEPQVAILAEQVAQDLARLNGSGQ